jgi:CDP-diacylglycerol--glycerol-3-phosphate 3-phosphatidyltransferase
MSRIGMAVVLLVLLAIPFPFGKTIALVLFVMAGITDYLDGHLARNVYGVTSFGKLMDPLADKVITCVAFVSFVEIQIPSYPGQPLLPAWMVVLIISREFLVTGLRLLAAGKGKLISAGQWGKHKTIWQIIAITAILLGLAIRDDILRHASGNLLANYDFAFHWLALGLGSVVVLITVISGYKYFAENFDLIQHNL